MAGRKSKLGPGPGPWGGKKPPKEKRSLAVVGGHAAADAMALREITASLPAVPKRDRMTPEAVEECLGWLSSGGSVSSYARATGIPYSTVSKWMRKDEKRYQAAKDAGSDAIAEALMRIAVTPDPQTERTVITESDGSVKTVEKTSDAVFARKLAVWAGMELLKKRSPKTYGDHKTAEVNVTLATAISRARDRVREAGEPSGPEVIDAEVVAPSPEDARRLALSRVAGASSPDSPSEPPPDNDDDWI